jgi:hypothetical protein
VALAHCMYCLKRAQKKGNIAAIYLQAFTLATA